MGLTACAQFVAQSDPVCVQSDPATATPLNLNSSHVRPEWSIHFTPTPSNVCPMFSSMPTVKTPFLCVCWFLHVQRLNVSPIAILVVWARVGGSFQWFRNYEKILAFLQKHKAQVPENPNGKRLLYEFVRDDRDGRIISQYSIADNKSVYIHAYMYIHAYIKKYIHIIYIYR